jgi:hypothetical protein
MAQTTLNLRLLLTMQRSRATFSIVALGLLLLSSSFVTGCGSGGDGELPTSAASGEDGSAVPTGPASASLAWDPVSGVLGYMIHMELTHRAPPDPVPTSGRHFPRRLQSLWTGLPGTRRIILP